ncbi:U3 snoRNA associated-domain-containing protein [Massariosphaeria phaeospora]|uniref:U3 snoRNA associated-domain-containing protein n=1 Tax=Massariosphaeria phaeospora TaxID=100035 RepID=A0A7C8IAY0_9PLEO|nr:U3 snoRNA associated-domain-containing protein [Massariosphaeria phaeospora]
MFTKVLDTARRILSQSPSIQEQPNESREATPRSHDLDLTMVTTRRGTGTPIETAGDTTPRSSAGRAKRTLEVEETPTVIKRRRRVVELKQSAGHDAQVVLSVEETETLENIDVAVPSIKAGDFKSSSTEEKDKLPIRRRTSPRVVVSKTQSPSTGSEPVPVEPTEEQHPSSAQETVFHTPNAQQDSSVYATPATRGKGAGSPTPKTVPHSGQASSRLSATQGQGQKKQIKLAEDSATVYSSFPDEIPSSTWETDHAPISTQDSVQFSPLPPGPTSRKIRFDSEDPADVPSPVIMDSQDPARFEPPVAHQSSNTLAATEDQDYESESDDAPEVVTTASAVSKAKAAEEDAARAHKAQTDKDERKRKERAERIAEEQAQKKKRDEKKAKKLAKKLKKQAQQQQSVPEDAPLAIDIHKLPTLLPASLLEAAGDQRPATPPPLRAGKTAEEARKEKLNRHKRFLERSERPVKDVKKGRVNVAVLQTHNKLLAPKVNNETRTIRESWLKGRQLEKKRRNGKPVMQNRKVERRVTGGGFLRGED